MCASGANRAAGPMPDDTARPQTESGPGARRESSKQNPCRATYNPRMAYPPKAPALTTVRGWRARAWAWVLFLALFKGLVPHAALAAALMPGGPALLWCAPGKDRIEDRSAGAETPASAQHCVCATFSDASSTATDLAPPPPACRHEALEVTATAPTDRPSLWLPPPRGPPSA